jgi:putative transcriptional regulator
LTLRDPMKNNLRVYRALTNMTQAELSEKIGVSRQTIICIEGEKFDPSLELAFKISRFFKVRIEDVFLFDHKEK